MSITCSFPQWCDRCSGVLWVEWWESLMTVVMGRSSRRKLTTSAQNLTTHRTHVKTTHYIWGDLWYIGFTICCCGQVCVCPCMWRIVLLLASRHGDSVWGTWPFFAHETSTHMAWYAGFLAVFMSQRCWWHFCVCQWWPTHKNEVLNLVKALFRHRW